MVKEIVKKCPICNSDMVISELKCPKCEIAINGEFLIPNNEHSESSLRLSDEELGFVKDFLRFEGNISMVQKQLGLSYGQVKSILNSINIKIGNKEGKIMNKIETIDVKNSIKASDIIKSKLNETHGEAECPMLKGEPQKIWLTQEGVVFSGYPNLVCKWEIIDDIENKIKELGGKMYRGDGAAQKGRKIGSEEFPLDTIDAYIGIKYYGAQVGKTTTRRSTYYAAILTWAGVCLNYKSDGNSLGG
ncbi:MAG: DUF2089 family protein, partial [Clostridia bacterium]|nr:DUF2089 family protein [Clostridia bacterium]